MSLLIEALKYQRHENTNLINWFLCTGVLVHGRIRSLQREPAIEGLRCRPSLFHRRTAPRSQWQAWTEAFRARFHVHPTLPRSGVPAYLLCCWKLWRCQRKIQVTISFNLVKSFVGIKQYYCLIRGKQTWSDSLVSYSFPSMYHGAIFFTMKYFGDTSIISTSNDKYRM